MIMSTIAVCAGASLAAVHQVHKTTGISGRVRAVCAHCALSSRVLS